MTRDDGTAFGPYSWTPAELQEILHAERDAERRKGGALLILRNGAGALRIFKLGKGVPARIGRGETRDLLLAWDRTVSREHATLTHGDAGWSVLDDGSRHGTFIKGIRLGPRKRQWLENRDVLKVGNTKIQFREPPGDDLGKTKDKPPGDPDDVQPEEPTDAQMKVLRALCAPFCEDDKYAVTPSNLQIAEALGIKEDTVKTHMRALFARYDIPDAGNKRLRLAQAAMEAGPDPCVS